MNIIKFLNSYLIDKTYRLTLVSVTLTALAPLIATLVDGLFSSNLLGNDAFIAVSVSLLIVNAVSVLTMICERGGAVLAAGQLAKGNREKANRIYTVAFVSAMLVASLVYGYWEHRKHPFYTMFSLVDKMLQRIKFECSIDYERQNLDEMKRMMKLFADTYEMTDEVSKKMYATIKDCGRPYDPVANGMDAASFGARSATYRYMFTMNVTTIVWDKI